MFLYEDDDNADPLLHKIEEEDSEVVLEKVETEMSDS